MMSQPSRSVHWFCKLNKIPHTVSLVQIAKGQHLSPQYKQIHPFNKVPAIEDKGLKIFESHTIMRYLSQEYEVVDHWYPKDFKQRIKIDEYLDWHHTGVRKGAASLFGAKFLMPRQGKEPPRAETIQRYETDVESSLEAMETFWLKDSLFIGASKPSIADLSSFCEFSQLKTIKYNFSKWQKVSQWMKRMEELPHYDESFAILNKVLSKL